MNQTYDQPQGTIDKYLQEEMHGQSKTFAKVRDGCPKHGLYMYTAPTANIVGGANCTRCAQH